MQTINQELFIKLCCGSQLWKRFKADGTPPANIGASRDYNVDMVPKVCYYSTL
jgi:hypothetical protein